MQPAIIPWGFRGDPFLIATVDALVKTASIDCFVETGAFCGVTLHHMATSYELACYSCEPDATRFQLAQERVIDLPRTMITNEESPPLLHRLAQTIPDARVLFWLDAHGYGFDWPLREEIAIITATWPTASILIDDFRVPGCDWFGFDSYDGQECSLEYIHDIITPYPYRLWYPSYPALSVTNWPCRGWGLLAFDPTHSWQAPSWMVETKRH